MKRTMVMAAALTLALAGPVLAQGAADGSGATVGKPGTANQNAGPASPTPGATAAPAMTPTTHATTTHATTTHKPVHRVSKKMPTAPNATTTEPATNGPAGGGGGSGAK